ncbi:MAG TPA: palindromic element RPE4 domain-containing protein [Rickettsia endosymbiont of Omalisus fontisbellaquei]|nr:palindromic element RPE4 domain-containing protein [Rickettsia endosymbiont of Omalisus fontisbellaquei]
MQSFFNFFLDTVVKPRYDAGKYLLLVSYY